MFRHSENLNDLSALKRTKWLMQIFRWFSFSVGSVSPPRLLGSFQHLGVCTHKCLKHLCDLGALKVPRKVHENRLTHLCVAVVNRLGNSTSHQQEQFLWKEFWQISFVRCLQTVCCGQVVCSVCIIGITIQLPFSDNRECVDGFLL